MHSMAQLKFALTGMPQTTEKMCVNFFFALSQWNLLIAA